MPAETEIRASRADSGGAPVITVRRTGDSAGLRALVLSVEPGRARIALVADGALLLAGDQVTVRCAVGPGVRLDIVETSGTVAYAMRGGRASWTLDLDIAGELTWSGLPFIAATGAVVARRTTVRLRGEARVLIRETAVLGRTGETGGEINSLTQVVDDEGELLVEQLTLSSRGQRPGILGRARVLDTVLAVGHPPPEGPVLTLDRRGWLARELLDDYHENTMDQCVRAICSWTENSSPSAAAR